MHGTRVGVGGLTRCHALTLRALGVASLSVLASFGCTGGSAKPDAAGASSGGSASGGTGGSGAGGGSGGAGTGGTSGSGGANVGGNTGDGTGGRTASGGSGSFAGAGGRGASGGSGPGEGGRAGTGASGRGGGNSSASGGSGGGGGAGTGGSGSGGTPDAAVDGPADAAETICAGLAQLSLGGVLWREQPEGTNTWIETVPVVGGIFRLTITLSSATTFTRYPTVTLTTPNSAAAFGSRPMVLFAVLAGKSASIDWYVTFGSSLTTGTTIPFHAELSADQGELKCAGAPALDFSVTLR